MPNAIFEAAQTLLSRRLRGEPGPRLPEACRPEDIETALAIQAQVSQQIDDTIGGWKCGLPSAGRVVVAPIYKHTVHCHSPVSLFARAGHARVEPELAFSFGADLPARSQPYTEADIDAAIGSTHLALELIQSRYDDPAGIGFAEALADGLVNQGLLLGPSVELASARDAVSLPLRIQFGHTSDKVLSGYHPGGAPLAPLYWLVEFLRGRGLGIAAGQVVITGSYAGVLELPLNEEIEISFGHLGGLKAQFVAKG